MNISVIIPTYNVELNLQECLNSVLSQNKEHFEVICVDDGSEDETLKLLQYFEKKYKNIRVIESTHKGVSFVRNLGIREAKGEYICFMDADDMYPENDVLSTLYTIAKNTSADIVGGSFSDFSDTENCISYDGDLSGYTFHKDGWIDYRDYQFDYGFHRFIFRREFLMSNHIFFPELVRFQDPPFLVKALHMAGGFEATSKIVYKYRLSASGVEWTENKICDCISGIAQNMIFARQEGYDRLYDYSVCRLVRLLYDELVQNEKKSSVEIIGRMNQMRFLLPEAYEQIGIEECDLEKFKLLMRIYHCERKPILTIVVPAYNVEKYIKRCLNSLVWQTNGICKLVIVNDGSTDGTAEICASYAEKYPGQINYIYQENKGLGAARNTGLAIVDTPYITFLDSDDWQDIRFVEKLDKLISELDYMPDMIFSLPRCYNESSHSIENWMDKELYEKVFHIDLEERKSIDIKTCPELYLLEVNANRKIYRTEFLKENNFAFPEGVKWEDIRPHVQLLHLANSCVALPDTGFIYRTNVAGQITAGKGAGRLDIIKVFEDTLEFVKNNYYETNEWEFILDLICNYTMWMIDMTDLENIHLLLNGLHKVFLNIPDEIIDSYNKNFSDGKGRNEKIGLIQCMRENNYNQLVDYENRKNIYRYWSIHGGKKKNIVSGGIQCMKDSGLRYTLKLILRKVLYQGF